MIRSVAFQGERGAYSEIAALKYFGRNIAPAPSLTFDSVFEKIKNHEVSYGIIPVENSLYGIVFETYDLLLKYSLAITGEINLKINHYLLAKQELQPGKIKKIYSHPQALGQCSNYLKKLKNSEIVPAYDTAGSAKIVKNSDEEVAAIASKEAGRIYGLKTLKNKIQNNKDNYTRFLILGNKIAHIPGKNLKSSICFELKNIPGALFKALSVFALRDIDLLKIESRPIPHKPFQYSFYVDFKGCLQEVRIKQALNHLKEISLSLKLFGSYQTGKTYSS